MKKLIVAVLMVLMLSITALAGPLLGFSVAPGTLNPTLLTVGYDFGLVNIEAWKGNLTTPYGFWAFGVLWTPSQGSFGYRVGGRLILNWQNTGLLMYNGFDFVLGVSDTWGPIQIYAEVDIAPIGVLAIVPSVGLNILFDGLMPVTGL